VVSTLRDENATLLEFSTKRFENSEPGLKVLGKITGPAKDTQFWESDCPDTEIVTGRLKPIPAASKQDTRECGTSMTSAEQAIPLTESVTRDVEEPKLEPIKVIRVAENLEQSSVRHDCPGTATHPVTAEIRGGA
jgi:hypothetical protein